MGTVVKTSEEDDPIAVFTVLNTSRHAGQDWLKQLHEFLRSKCTDKTILAKMDQASSTVFTLFSVLYVYMHDR